MNLSLTQRLVTRAARARPKGMRRKLVLVVLTLAASTAGVATAAPNATHASRSTVTVRSSAYGRILFDGRGFVLYAFTRDRGRSACSGACAKAWPPYLVTGRARAEAGVKSSLLGTTRRADGKVPVTD